MLTEKVLLKTETIFSDDRLNRYLLRKEWDTKKPKATIIMTNPSAADLRINYSALPHQKTETAVLSLMKLGMIVRWRQKDILKRLILTKKPVLWPQS